ncbi:amine oxidase [Hyaloraphidium curvatum]|nr:amine oxidase [Hyaloraphidium curvatum]
MGSSGGAEPPRVLVLGAGISGLACASQLARAGLRVTVLEARDRIGGRTHTADFPLADGTSVAVDLGGSWAHGTNNPELIARGLYAGRTHETERIVMHHPRGGAMPEDLSRAIRKAVYLPYEELAAKCQRIKLDRGKGEDGEGGDLDVPRRGVWEARIESMKEAAGVDDERGMEMLRIAPEILAIEMAADWGSLSCVDADWNPIYESETPDWYLVEGHRSILENLVRLGGLEVGTSIKLAEQVLRIEHGGETVRVTTTRGSYEAEAAVITFPLGVLQRQHEGMFSPSLPPAKVEALGKFRMGSVDKLYLRFANCFWPRDVDWFLAFLPPAADGALLPSPGPIPASTPLDPRSLHVLAFINLQAMHSGRDVPVLVCFHYGKTTELFERAGQAAVVDLLCRQLGHMFGLDPPPDCEHSLSGGWTSDPFSCGSYSHVPVGAGGPLDVLRHTEALAAPVGRVRFAGEHTSPDARSSVHGAFNAGMREARGVVEALGWNVDEAWMREASVQGGLHFKG